MNHNTTQLDELTRAVRELISLLYWAFPGLAPRETALLEHVDLHWIIEKLGIGKTTFYRQVRGRLLKPVLRIGAREYYSRTEVCELLHRHKDTHRHYRHLKPLEEMKEAA